MHYWHLQSWALEASKEFGCENFKASKHFINNFKTEYGITSRIITQIVTRNNLEEDEEIRKTASNFNEKINQLIKDTPLEPTNIWNCDQSGFNYEMSSRATLSKKGEKVTLATYQSINSITHSYTIDIALSMSGHLAKKMYICFQEKDGKFGSRVIKKIETNCPPNVVVECSKSGKMTKVHLKSFFEKVIEPELENKSLLLCDSWTGHKEIEIFISARKQKKVILEFIPPKTTKYAQPLDVYFFRQYKLYIRRIVDYVRLSPEDQQTNLHDRIFIMKLHSVVYNQFSSPKYQNMIKYAWLASGYSTGLDKQAFQNTIEISFDVGFKECAIEDINNDGTKIACVNLGLVICSHCSNPLCYFHLIEQAHMCNYK